MAGAGGGEKKGAARRESPTRPDQVGLSQAQRRRSTPNQRLANLGSTAKRRRGAGPDSPPRPETGRAGPGRGPLVFRPDAAAARRWRRDARLTKAESGEDD